MTETHSTPADYRIDFGKSVVRLPLREWMAVVLIVAGCFIAFPRLWSHFENLQISLDGRVPFEASEDYWAYRARIEKAVEADRIPIIGDSVVWGEYVSADETLSSDLNSEMVTQRFVNAGLNGAHPLALTGLVDYYTRDLKNRRVILHCNLLWMSSPDRDLQTENDVPINHVRLIPQFQPWIPAYRPAFAKRLGIVVDRSVSFFQCVDHVRTRYFDGKDLQTWTIANPYTNPAAQFQKEQPTDPNESRHAPVPWTKQGIERQDMPWVELSTSLQWQAWRQTAHELRRRGNTVLAIVGPFNEHLLLEPSRERHRAARAEVVDWLKAEQFSYVAPEALPSDEYGDASHPLRTGYARLAKSIVSDKVFLEWMGQ